MLNNQENFLIRHPLIGVIIIMILYGLFITGSLVFTILIFWYSSYLILLLGYTIILFFALMILFLLIIPFGLHLPNGKKSFKQWSKTIGLSVFRPLKRHILLGILVYGVIIGSVLCFILLFGTIKFHPDAIFRSPRYGNLGYFQFIYSLNAAIWEEIAYRGIILTLLTKKYSEKNSIIISSILFGLSHLLNFLFGSPLIFVIIQIFYATCFGIIFGYMFIKTKSLLPCIITHYLINTLLILVTITSRSFFSLIMIGVIGYAILPMILNLILIQSLFKSENTDQERI